MAVKTLCELTAEGWWVPVQVNFMAMVDTIAFMHKQPLKACLHKIIISAKHDDLTQHA